MSVIRPIPESPSPTGIASAIEAFVGGTAFIAATPRIWPFALVPAVVLTALWSVFTAMGVWGAAELCDWMFAPPRGTWAGIGYWVLIVLFSLLAILFAALIALTLAQPLSGPALERISLAQQRRLTGAEPPNRGFWHPIWVSVKALSFALVVGGAAIVLLFSVNWFFPPAVVVTVPLKFLVGAWILAWDFLDYPMGLRGLGVRARLQWVRRNVAAFTAFGMIGALFTVVPGAVLLLLPVGVAGATRLILKDDPRYWPQ